MELDYRALSEAGGVLHDAAGEIRGRQWGIPPGLGAELPGPDSAHEHAVNERTAAMVRLAEMLESQGTACVALVDLFRALDGQLAARAG